MEIYPQAVRDICVIDFKINWILGLPLMKEMGWEAGGWGLWVVNAVSRMRSYNYCRMEEH